MQVGARREMASYGTLIESNMNKLYTYSIIHRVVCIVLLTACAYITPFDASHIVACQEAFQGGIISHFFSSLLRWDVFHFLEVARSGYKYEHMYAFLPGMPMVLRMISAISLNGQLCSTLWGVSIFASALITLPFLYRLTLLQTGSQELAMLSAASSIITSSPITLNFASYSEPFFAFCSISGMRSL